MEERKTAAIVLSILAFILIFFTVILPYFKLKSDQTLSFKTCTVHFKYRYSIDTTEDAYTVAQNELALCLCKVYDKKQDIEISKRIMKIFKKYGSPISPDSASFSKYNNLDSVLKYRKVAFDPMIAVD
ncbi:MAG TPA: hypothetical protein VGN20_11055 [Mucilaginibacter sp.]|jgi:hypothetical protein